jgi:hypothetical protein
MFDGAKELDSRYFAVGVTIKDPDAKTTNDPAPDAKTPSPANSRPVSTLTVNLNFRGDLPEKKAGRAVLILWSVRLKTNPNTFILPQNWEEHSEYPYDVKYTHPCLRTTTTFSFSERKTPNKGCDYLFVEPRSDEHFQVIYGNIVHERESYKFKRQHRDREDLRSAPTYIAPPRPSFTFVLDSVLPSALYKTRLWIERTYPPSRSEHREEEPNSPAHR